MLLPSLLVAVALLAEPKVRCAPEGLYQATAGFFTRFDGRGHWQSMTRPRDPHAVSGRYDVDRDQIRFKAGSDGETAYDWSATFSEDCNSIVLKYVKGFESDIRFVRVAG